MRERPVPRLRNSNDSRHTSCAATPGLGAGVSQQLACVPGSVPWWERGGGAGDLHFAVPGTFLPITGHIARALHLQEAIGVPLGLGSGGSGSQAPFLLNGLQMWQNIEDAEWRPQTYLELEGLPCILIFSGMDPHGESLPR